MRKIVTLITLFLLMLITAVSAQERAILMPIQVNGAPFSFDDSDDMFGESYRWFREGDIDQAADVLRKTITSAGVTLDPAAHYVVVAHYTDSFAPIGMIHGEESDFFNTRLFGLGEDNLYYIFVSRTPDAPSFLSVMATAKDSPFNENLLGFLGLLGIFNSTQSTVQSLGGAATTYVDVRRFTIPEVFRKFSDISFLVKKELSDERDLAAAIFDNTSKERWSFGLALGMTSVNDVDIIIGSDGTIIVQPKPGADVAAFGVVNYHFSAVDTKRKNFGNSIHLLGGLRIGGNFEPLVGIGGGVSLGFLDIALFGGYSLEVANELAEGYQIGQFVDEEVDPFKTTLRGKPRFGLEVKLP